MTLQEVQALTDDEIRVKVAELQGWENIQSVKNMHGAVMAGDHADLIEQQRNYPLKAGIWGAPIPNYPADLNACHEVERTLTIDQASQYGQELIALCSIEHWATHPPAGDHDYHFTARARCEALLLTLTQP